MTWKFPLGNNHTNAKIRKDYQQCWLKSWTCYTARNKIDSAWVPAIIKVVVSHWHRLNTRSKILFCLNSWQIALRQQRKKRRSVVSLTYQYRVKCKTQLNIQLLYKLSMFTRDSSHFTSRKTVQFGVTMFTIPGRVKRWKPKRWFYNCSLHLKESRSRPLFGR